MAKKNTDSSSDPGFEQLLDSLTEIVNQLESPELPLEQALSSFERGIDMVRSGQKSLDQATQKVEMLVAEDRSEP